MSSHCHEWLPWLGGENWQVHIARDERVLSVPADCSVNRGPILFPEFFHQWCSAQVCDGVHLHHCTPSNSVVVMLYATLRIMSYRLSMTNNNYWQVEIEAITHRLDDEVGPDSDDRKIVRVSFTEYLYLQIVFIAIMIISLSYSQMGKIK